MTSRFCNRQSSFFIISASFIFKLYKRSLFFRAAYSLFFFINRIKKKKKHLSNILSQYVHVFPCVGHLLNGFLFLLLCVFICSRQVFLATFKKFNVIMCAQIFPTHFLCWLSVNENISSINCKFRCTHQIRSIFARTRKPLLCYFAFTAALSLSAMFSQSRGAAPVSVRACVRACVPWLPSNLPIGVIGSSGAAPFSSDSTLTTLRRAQKKRLGLAVTFPISPHNHKVLNSINGK